jgi:hypothetical protein
MTGVLSLFGNGYATRRQRSERRAGGDLKGDDARARRAVEVRVRDSGTALRRSQGQIV